MAVFECRRAATRKDTPTHNRNPFFIEEVVRAVREQTISATRTAELQIPSSVQEVRLNCVVPLGAEPCAVLQVAAVLGPSFSERMLRESWATCRRWIATSRRCSSGHCCARSGARTGRVRLPVRPHAEGDLRGDSCPAAARVASTGRGVAGDDVRGAGARSIRASGLPLHLCQAWEQAQRYLLAAGDQAGRLAADAKALGHYERALAAYGRVFGERGIR